MGEPQVSCPVQWKDPDLSQCQGAELVCSELWLRLRPDPQHPFHHPGIPTMSCCYLYDMITLSPLHMIPT